MDWYTTCSQVMGILGETKQKRRKDGLNFIRLSRRIAGVKHSKSFIVTGNSTHDGFKKVECKGKVCSIFR